MPAPERPRRACDRCHSLKERCRWTGDTIKCDRCTRLNQDCQTDRPAQKIGRRPRSRPVNLHAISSHSSTQEPSVITPELPSSPSVLSSQTQRMPYADIATPDSLTNLEADVTKSLSAFEQLDDLERSVLELCFANQEAVGQFTIGKSFHKQHQRDLLTRLSKATVQLKDGFICCGAMFAQSLNIVLPPPVLDMCQRRAANAVLSLRALEVSTRQDVSTCLVLGVVVTTFALYVAGGETESICRWVLAQLKPLHDTGLDLAPDELSFLNCLIFTETVECLLRGHVPTLRLKLGCETEVDRYFGLSTSIMGYLYDICVISDALSTADATARLELSSQLDDLEHEVRKWRLSLPHDIQDRFDQSEIVNILAQAKSLRLTMLLLIHRLRFPFGERTEYGRALAEAIIIEIELAEQITRQVAEGLDVAIIVSFFELETREDRDVAFAKIDKLVPYSESFKAKLRGQLTSVWSARNSGCVMYWYDLRHHQEPSNFLI